MNNENFHLQIGDEDENFNLSVGDRVENFNLTTDENVESFGLSPNDEDEEFTVEFGEVINDGGTHDYNELDNKPQINGNTLEGNKTNEQLGIPVYTEGTGITVSGNTISADTDVLATKADLNSKQNVIADLPQIRSGASAGATAVQPEDLARIATTGSYNDSLNKPSVNNVTLTGNKSLDALGIQPKGDYALRSEIPDVSNFITNTVDNLVNYYKKSETFTKQEVNDLISAITTMDVRVVQTLPTEDISATTIYLVPKATAGTNDAYDEYIYVSNAWEHIGSTDIDLSGYQTKIDNAHKLSSDLVDDTNNNHKFVSSTEKTTWNGKYTKPSGGIPKSDLTNDVQTSLGKADTALQSYTETDPTVPSYVKSITQANITSWSNKADIADIPTKLSELTADSSHRLVTDTEKTTWNNKQNEISDLSSIRSGANAGATAVQPGDLSTVATSGNYSDLSNKPYYYGTCKTAAATRAKVVECEGFVLEEGATISVTFTNAQTYNGSPQLNVNGTGAIVVQYKQGTAGIRYMWSAGEIIDFTYNGEYWVCHGRALATTSYYGVAKLYTGAGSDSQALASTPRSLYYFANYSIAPYYSASKTYAVGDKVRYTYYIYECITAIETPEAWNAEHWQQVDTLQEQIDAINTTIGDIDTILTRLTTGSGV